MLCCGEKAIYVIVNGVIVVNGVLKKFQEPF